MSGTITGLAAGEPGGRLLVPLRRAGWLTPVNAAIVATTVLAFCLRGYLLARHLMGVHEYDDGPYFGSAVRLVNGVMPYRDFIFVQPPGITLLMSPAGLLAGGTGTAWGLVTGRILTVLASTAGVALAGLVVRHRGVLTVLVTCGLVAVYPASVAAAHTVLVEPWLVLFCLAGAVAVFDKDQLAGPRRLAWGGTALGFAGAIELWAIVPVAVIAALCLPRLRQATVFVGGVAAGFLPAVLPFLVLAPRRFYQSLIVAQVGSRAGAARVPVARRLRGMTGLADSHLWGHGTVLLAAVSIVVFAAAALVGSSLITRHAPPALDWFALLTAGLVAGMFMWPPQFHYHFPAFLAPFLAMTVALPAGRLIAAAQLLAGGPGAGRPLRWCAVGLAGAVLLVFAAVQARSESGGHRLIGTATAAAAAQVIPPGACVLSDEVTFLLLADRFVSDVLECSQMVDPIGTDLALSGGRKPYTGAGDMPAVAALWRGAFGHAQFVLLSGRNALRIAWTPGLKSYFHTNFTQVLKRPGYTVYARNQHVPHHTSSPAGLGTP